MVTKMSRVDLVAPFKGQVPASIRVTHMNRMQSEGPRVRRDDGMVELGVVQRAQDQHIGYAIGPTVRPSYGANVVGLRIEHSRGDLDLLATNLAHPPIESLERLADP